MLGELEGEGGEAAAVLAEFGAVEVDGRGGHDAFKVDKDAFAAGVCGDVQGAAVEGDELVVFLVEAVPGEADVGVGEDDGGEGGVVEGGGAGGFGGLGGVAPAAVDGEDGAAGGRGGGCDGLGEGGGRDDSGNDGGGGSEGSGGLEEGPAIHGAPDLLYQMLL